MTLARVTITTEERIALLTVGIDIGSATSQIMFSRLRLDKVGTRYVVVERTTLHQSDVFLTPYKGATIDGRQLREVVDLAYAGADLTPSEIDTGALIVTGVALDRHNARVIADVFAAEAGKFVTVSAGDHLEAIMAAYGSGALDASRARRGDVLNIDIGGGTTKLALCRAGIVLGVAAVDVGARLITFDSSGRVNAFEPAGGLAAERIGIQLRLGQTLAKPKIAKLASYLADCVMGAMPGSGVAVGDGLRTESLPLPRPPVAINFSGGVSEYIHGREARDFGDLGPSIGRAVAARVHDLGYEMLPPSTGIRATVLGVSQYAVQVSGSTIDVPAADLLPLRNVPVAGPPIAVGPVVDEGSIAAEVRARLAALTAEGPVALPVTWTGSATWERLDSLGRGLLAGASDVVAVGRPLVLVFDEDISHLVGRHMNLEMGVTADLLCIDCLELRQFDFIDIGAPLPGATAVPVVIKSLVFGMTG